MKEGWELHTLGDVATFINGDRSTNYPSKKDYVVDGIPFVNAGNLIQTGLDIASLNFISQDKYDSLTQGRFVEGDILFCLRGTLGKHSIVQNGLKGAVASSLVIIRTKDGFCNKYISYYLDYKQPFIERLNNGAAQPNIPAKTMKGFSIQFPPNQKQQQSIVEYLDSAFAKIDAMKANAEKALNEAKALFQASLKEMLEPKEGWEEKALKDLGQTQTGTTPSKSEKSNYGDYIEFIRPSEIDYDGNGRIDYNCEIKLSEQGASKGRIFASNSILMVCIGATIGKVGFSIKEVSCNQQINVFTPSNDFNYKFVYYAMRSPSFQHRVIKEGTSSQATLPIINKGKWEQLSISFPEIKEQEVIATHLDNLSSKVSDLKENYDKISQECDALKQAILRQVFE